MKRAVITGLGIVSSIGNNQQEVLASLREGRSGITFSQELKDAGMRSQVWGNVKLDTTGLIDRKVVRFMSDALHLCLSVYGAGCGRRRSGAGSLSE
ncbi:3-oxoacyl-ACP synthase [Salmonella enterica subsp. salamae]|nr:3-oxoacyl-ACP synthase [Salmonella enterica subsp. salamae]